MEGSGWRGRREFRRLTAQEWRTSVGRAVTSTGVGRIGSGRIGTGKLGGATRLHGQAPTPPHPGRFPPAHPSPTPPEGPHCPPSPHCPHRPPPPSTPHPHPPWPSPLRPPRAPGGSLGQWPPPGTPAPAGRRSAGLPPRWGRPHLGGGRQDRTGKGRRPTPPCPAGMCRRGPCIPLVHADLMLSIYRFAQGA